ncbi:hypothetical protein BU17DRAFT_43928 [Hysterangium stoloniferum]|nr:hypothetical protein BU17DRAFT_43928 [Hysterangium stoloniferum]
MLRADLWEEPFLTSPQLDDSPEETPFINTPLDGTDTSPMIGFEDDSFNLGGMPLFEPTASDSFDASKVESVTPALPPLDQAMYTIPSTPSFAPATLQNAATSNTLSLPPSTSSAVPQSSRVTKTIPTGTRRNITPSALVPLDAPTQPRQYVTPSVTSRKVIPAAFIKGKKRSHSEIPDDDEEEVDISHLDPNTKEAIEAKRRQNTLAARRSRQRKLEHVRELEETVQNLTQDRDEWMQRAYQAEEKLRVHGLEP